VEVESCEFEVALLIVLECLGSSVRRPSVGFHDQALLSPEEVDREPADPLVDLGCGDAVATT
jgi:hypothetical protein